MNYENLIFGVQALRRQAELKQCPVLGAAGVRAFCYPHQLYVARQVLSHTKIRHLLADEVGLGKTIEALMIMNALRIRNNGKLRVSIVVSSPERAKQWRSEICGRFHYPFWRDDVLENGIARDDKILDLRRNNNVFFDVTGEGGIDKGIVSEFPDDGFKIVFPQSFDTDKKYLDPDRIDLLILDEIHSFSNDLINFLSSRSAEYQSVLVLSATPLLGDEFERLQLLKLLNPDEAEWAELTRETPELRNVHLLRSRRLDFPKALPQRKPIIRRIEPLQNDIDRIRKSHELLRDMLRQNIIDEENAALFARRVTIGGQTLIDRIDDYRRVDRYPQYEQYVEKLTELRILCATEQGDPRFDELLDYLLEFFAEDGSKKVIIAAQDSPTIDYLTEQIKRCLPEVGPEGQCKQMQVLQLKYERRSRTYSDDSQQDDAKDKNRSVIEQFWNDKHQILIAHNDARESYNLQIADSLVFYSLPWKPIDMEQWLGRISRLGLRKPKTAEIVALVLRDSIDEKITDIYRSLNMFEHPLDLEENQSILQEIETTIQQAVLYDRLPDFSRYVKQLRQEDTVEKSELFRITPEKDARDIDKKVQDDIVQPVIQRTVPQQKNKRIFPMEEGLDAWISLLEQQKYLSILKYQDDNYVDNQRKKYYRFLVMDKLRDSRISPPFLLDDPVGVKPFLVRRAKIQIPPRDLVPVRRGGQRYEIPLQFFNFGSQLHDDFVNHFAEIFRWPKLYTFSITFNNAELLSPIQGGEYCIGILTTQRKSFPHPSLLTDLLKSDNKTQDEMRQIEQRRFETGLIADDRFLDLLYPGTLEIHGFERSEDKKWNPIDSKDIYGLLTQIPKSHTPHQPTRDIPENFLNRFMQLAKDTAQQSWQCDYQNMLDARVATLQDEFNMREGVLQFKIRELQRKIEEETNQDTIIRNYEPAKKRFQEQLDLARKSVEIRKMYLTDCVGAEHQVECSCKAVIHLSVTIGEDHV